MRKIFFSTVLIFTVFSGIAQTEKIKNGHFEIKYDTEIEPFALASARILNFTWDKLDELGFKPPKKIKFNLVKSDRDMLYVDKDNPIITLEYTSLDWSKTGKNFVYGLCHEMGHVCMFNLTPNKNNWMTRDYREGWAHCFGESMVVLLYEKFGVDVWHTPYNYLAQMTKSFAAIRTQAIEKGEGDNPGFFISAFFWEKLVNEKGMDKIPIFFRQIKSRRGVTHPDAVKKIRANLVKFDVSSDLLNYFDQNRKYLILPDYRETIFF